MKAIAIHVYAGGFSLGIGKHFDVVAHLENTDYGAETVNANLDVDIQQSPWALEDYSDIDLVFGNPPCAPWSSLGVGKGKDDPRFQDTLSILNAADTLKPKFVVFESVQNIMKRGPLVLEELENRMMDKGYSVTHLKHDAQDFGIPQRRKRYFFVAHKVEFNPKHPEMKATCIADVLKTITPGGYNLIRPCDERIWNGRLHLIKPGQVMRKVELKNERNKTAIGCYRLNGNGVARAFVGDYAIIHHQEDRPITVNEVKAICGFPQDYKIIAHSRQKTLNQLAQGVMPPVAEWLGSQIKQAINNNKPINTPSIHHFNESQEDTQTCLKLNNNKNKTK